MIDWLIQFAANLWTVTLEAAPWLLLGMVVAGLIRGWLPMRILGRWLGGKGPAPVTLAAVVGTPLPLCSCSVVPAALSLRRGGASKGATTSFLVSTPENGADSIALSYALLGPVMTVARVIAAIVSAIAAGILVSVTDRIDTPTGATSTGSQPSANQSGCCDMPKIASCCDAEPAAAGSCCDAPARATSCCESTSADAAAASCCESGQVSGQAEPTTFVGRTIAGLRFAFGKLFSDIAGWMALGVVLAALIMTIFPAGDLAALGSSPWAMLVMLVVGVPMYICATASTPVAASLLIAGVSPGAVLVFLLAGPATNIGTVAIIRKELGSRATAMYLLAVSAGAIGFGLLLNSLTSTFPIKPENLMHHEHSIIPPWIAITSAIALIALGSYQTLGRSLLKRISPVPNNNPNTAPANGNTHGPAKPAPGTGCCEDGSGDCSNNTATNANTQTTATA